MSVKTLVRLLISLASMYPAGTFSSFGQEPETLYSLRVYVGGGYTRNFSRFEPIPGLDLNLQRNGVGGFVRVMWKPEHLLRVGLETGISQVYSVSGENLSTEFGQTNFGSYLSVVPLSLTFSMPLTDHLEGSIGSTSYFLFSKTWSFGNTVSGLMISIGFSAALAYMWPMNEDWDIGCELKWYHIEKSRDDNAMIQVVASYRFFEW